jgi:hypothetical protein
VLNDLTATLERAQVDVQPLLGGADKPRRAAKAKLEEAAARAEQKLAEHRAAEPKAPEVKPQESRAAAPKQASLPMRGDPPELGPAAGAGGLGRSHIHILTEKITER